MSGTRQLHSSSVPHFQISFSSRVVFVSDSLFLFLIFLNLQSCTDGLGSLPSVSACMGDKLSKVAERSASIISQISASTTFPITASMTYLISASTTSLISASMTFLISASIIHLLPADREGSSSDKNAGSRCRFCLCQAHGDLTV